MPCLNPSIFEERDDRTRRYLRGDELAAARLPGPKPLSLKFAPCNRCELCVGSVASKWATRGAHEATLWRYLYLVTLTFDDAHYPGSQAELEQRMVDWLKRVRENREGETIRTMGCTELGDRTRRPHGHVLLMCDFELALGEVRGTGARGDAVHQCAEVQDKWPFGFANVSGGLCSASLSGGNVAELDRLMVGGKLRSAEDVGRRGPVAGGLALVGYVTAHQSEPGLGRMMLCEHERELVRVEKKGVAVVELRPVATSVFLRPDGGGVGAWRRVVDGWLCTPSGELHIDRRGGRLGTWRVAGRPYERARRDGAKIGEGMHERLRVKVHWYEQCWHPVSGEAVYFRPSAAVLRSRGLGYEWADKHGLAACAAGALVQPARGGSAVGKVRRAVAQRLPLPSSIRRRVTRDMSEAERDALGAEARAAADARAVERGATPGGWDTTPERRAAQLEVYRARKVSTSKGRGGV
mgnify:CR=1 FL=1